MVSELEIFQVANLYLKQHGEDAEIVAATRADELLASGEIDGERMWLRVIRAIKELRRTVPDRTLH